MLLSLWQRVPWVGHPIPGDLSVVESVWVPNPHQQQR